MAEKKEPADLQLTKQAVAGDNDVTSPRVPEGEIWCFQHITAEDLDSAPDEIRIMKAGAGGEFPVYEDTSPAANTLTMCQHNFYMTPGQYLLVRFTTCSADDRLRVYATGYREQREG